MTDDFNWTDELVAVPEQAAIAVYSNPLGAVVIRQAGQHGIDDDHWVAVAPQYAVRLARSILLEAGSDHVVAHCDDVADGMCGGVDPAYYNRHGPVHRDSAPGAYSIDWPAANAAFDDFEQAENPKAKDPTAAERKRRQRKRDRDTVTGRDIDRDSVTVAPRCDQTAELPFEPAG